MPTKHYPALEKRSYFETRACPSTLAETPYDNFFTDICKCRGVRDKESPATSDGKSSSEVMWNGRCLWFYIKEEVLEKDLSHLESALINNNATLTSLTRMPSKMPSKNLVEIGICCAVQIVKELTLQQFLEGYIKYCCGKGWHESVETFKYHKKLIEQFLPASDTTSILSETKKFSSSTLTKSGDFNFIEGKNTWLNPYNPSEIPFTGRKHELKQLDTFANHPDLLKIWAIEGKSGAGKTRLMVHWARILENKGWYCIKLKLKHRKNHNFWTNWQPEYPTLFILDYMFGYKETLSILLGRFQEQAGSIPIRLLVLDHAFDRPLQDDPCWGLSQSGTASDFNEKLFFKQTPLELKNNTDSHKEVIENIIHDLTGENSQSIEVSKAIKYLEDTTGAYQPIFAALTAEAINDKKQDDILIWNRRELIKYHLKGEREVWRKDAEGQLASCFIATATARKGATISTLVDIAHSYFKNDTTDYEKIFSICKKILGDKDNFNLYAFEPDLLGESFFIFFLETLKLNPRLQKTFRKLLEVKDENINLDLAFSYSKFFDKLISNLLNDSSGFCDKHLPTLVSFLDPSKFSKGSEIRWAANTALINIAREFYSISLFLPQKEPIELVDETDFCPKSYPSLVFQSTKYTLLYFDIKGKRRLLSEPSDISISLINNYFPMSNKLLLNATVYAAEKGYANALKVLLKFPAESYSWKHDLDAALFSAIKHDKDKALAVLLDSELLELEKTDPYYLVDEMITACKFGNLRTLDLLIEYGLDFRNLNGMVGAMAMMISSYFDYEDLTQYILYQDYICILNPAHINDYMRNFCESKDERRLLGLMSIETNNFFSPECGKNTAPRRIGLFYD